MPSTFFGLQISYSGLKASNAALNTTANNVANVETEGFSRQHVVTAAAESMRVFATYGCAGAGVDTLAIERIRDTFYDEKFRDNETRLGESERKEYYMSIMETYFKDDGTNGFKSIFDDMIDAMEEVTKNASSTSTKAAYVASVKSMTDYFNNMAGDLRDLQKDVNDEIKVQVGQINSIAEEIATVNKQINVIELSGAIANELRDKRDLLVDELSKYVDVRTKETPIYNAQNEDTGATRFIVQIAGGQTIVDQNEYNTLKCVAREAYEKVNQCDADGLYDIYWSNNTEFRLDNAAMGGSLKALGDLRDGNNGQNFQGNATAVGMAKKPDGTYTHTVSIETKADYLDNLSQCMLSDAGRIVIGAQEYYYSSWTVDSDPVTGEIFSYTFTLDDALCDEVITSAKIGKEAFMGSNSEYQGIPYYMNQMNEWVRLFAQTVNEIYTAGVTATGEDAGILITGESAASGQFGEDLLTGDAGYTGTFDISKGYYYITALNVAIESNTALDPDLLGSRKNAGNGVEECENIYSAISALADKSQMNFRGYDASGFLEAVLSDVALNTSNARTFTTSYLNLEKTLDNQRTSISGVDSDEEAVSLVKYENAYTLASKMIQTFSEIYDRLILETGV